MRSGLARSRGDKIRAGDAAGNPVPAGAARGHSDCTPYARGQNERPATTVS